MKRTTIILMLILVVSMMIISGCDEGCEGCDCEALGCDGEEDKKISKAVDEEDQDTDSNVPAS